MTALANSWLVLLCVVHASLGQSSANQCASGSCKKKSDVLLQKQWTPEPKVYQDQETDTAEPPSLESVSAAEAGGTDAMNATAWVVEDWGDCVSGCGDGALQFRDVKCRSVFFDKEAADGACSGPRPGNVRTCSCDDGYGCKIVAKAECPPMVNATGVEGGILAPVGAEEGVNGKPSDFSRKRLKGQQIIGEPDKEAGGGAVLAVLPGGDKPFWIDLRGHASSQSSTSSEFGRPETAIDGRAAPRYLAGSCTHTRHDWRPWWKVYLGNVMKVHTVRVTNRGDCCGWRLNSFNVLVDRQVCGDRSGRFSLAQGRTGDVNCKGVVGTEVKIQSLRHDYLTICEVDVRAQWPERRGSSRWLNLRRMKTFQVSTGWGGSSHRAVDGYASPRYWDNRCTHTQKQQSAWWLVKLPKLYFIHRVGITNRGDCCWHRLSNFHIRVRYSDEQRPARLGTRCGSSDHLSVKRGATVEFPCPGIVVGFEVEIINNRNDYLTLCEVRVKAEELI